MNQEKENNMLNNHAEHSNDVPMNLDEINAEEHLSEVLDTLPEDKRHQVICAMMQQTSYRGPLPHPEILKGYEKILPGAAERVFAMAESQQKHRMAMEETIVKNQISQSKKGQIWGGSLTVLFGLISLAFAFLGFPTLAGITLTTTIIGLATIFVLNKLPNSKKTNEDKDLPDEQE